jgi:hypothetical protein
MKKPGVTWRVTVGTASDINLSGFEAEAAGAAAYEKR